MDTSNCNEHQPQQDARLDRWKATALVFSGRRDPAWQIDCETAATLIQVWSALPPSTAAAHPPPLGYRGCSLTSPDGTSWHAFAGIVSMRSRRPEGQLEVSEPRTDIGRRFEIQLLATAPPGLVPIDFDRSFGESK
jgi:hypothetical protein